MLKQSSIELPQDGPRVGAAQSARGADARQARFRQRVLGLAALTLILVICYSRPLSHLAVFALQSELYDYNLLIPFVSLYLIWLKRNSLPLEVRPSWRWAALPLIVSLGMLGGYWLAVHNGWHPNRQNYLCLMIFSFLLSLLGAELALLGPRILKPVLFPVTFLILMVPFPEFLHRWIEKCLQLSSANVASGLFALTGMPVFREDTSFKLPGVTLDVAPECSGMHSSVVLFFTSLIASYLFLRTPWKRAVLTMFVLPLAIVRNGFRVFFIAQLCIRISPDMINSAIHKRGGPVFFVLSLIPFIWLLLRLRKGETARRAAPVSKRGFQPKRSS